MAIEHLLTMMDTPRSVSLKYFGTESRWEEIMAYNGLEYPYFVQDTAAYNLLYAHGYLTFTRTFFSGELVIYKGSTFTTRADNYGVRKMYEVTEDTMIPAGQATGYV